MERLCSKLSPPAPAVAAGSAGKDLGGGGGGGRDNVGGGAGAAAGAVPLPTEFRWVAIPLGMLVRSGTLAHRRKLLHRIVRCDLGLGRDTASGGDGDGDGDGGEGRRNAAGSLTYMDEAWVARVLLPALDQAGWHR